MAKTIFLLILLGLNVAALTLPKTHHLGRREELHLMSDEPTEAHQQSKVKKEYLYSYAALVNPQTYLGINTPSPRIMAYLPLLGKNGEVLPQNTDIKKVKEHYIKRLGPSKPVSMDKAEQLARLLGTTTGRMIVTYFEGLAKGGLNFYKLSQRNFRLWLAIKIIADKDVKMYARSVAENQDLFKQFYQRARNIKIVQINGIPEPPPGKDILGNSSPVKPNNGANPSVPQVKPPAPQTKPIDNNSKAPGNANAPQNIWPITKQNVPEVILGDNLLPGNTSPQVASGIPTNPPFTDSISPLEIPLNIAKSASIPQIPTNIGPATTNVNAPAPVTYLQNPSYKQPVKPLPSSTPQPPKPIISPLPINTPLKKEPIKPVNTALPQPAAAATNKYNVKQNNQRNQGVHKTKISKPAQKTLAKPPTLPSALLGRVQNGPVPVTPAISNSLLPQQISNKPAAPTQILSHPPLPSPAAASKTKDLPLQPVISKAALPQQKTATKSTSPKQQAAILHPLRQPLQLPPPHLPSPPQVPSSSKLPSQPPTPTAKNLTPTPVISKPVLPQQKPRPEPATLIPFIPPPQLPSPSPIPTIKKDQPLQPVSVGKVPPTKIESNRVGQPPAQPLYVPFGNPQTSVTSQPAVSPRLTVNSLPVGSQKSLKGNSGTVGWGAPPVAGWGTIKA